MWAGRIALPFRIADSQYEIQWCVYMPEQWPLKHTEVVWGSGGETPRDEIHFDNQLLGPVPEEGVSRLVTQRSSTRKDHYVRYGLAFQLEHGMVCFANHQLLLLRVWNLT